MYFYNGLFVLVACVLQTISFLPEKTSEKKGLRALFFIYDGDIPAFVVTDVVREVDLFIFFNFRPIIGSKFTLCIYFSYSLPVIF